MSAVLPEYLRAHILYVHPRPWRVGRKVARNVYDANNEGIAMFMHAYTAAIIVEAVNRLGTDVVPASGVASGVEAASVPSLNAKEKVKQHWANRYPAGVLLLCEESRAFGDGTGMDVSRPCICEKLTHLFRAAEAECHRAIEEAARDLDARRQTYIRRSQDEYARGGRTPASRELSAKGDALEEAAAAIRAITSGASAPKGPPKDSAVLEEL